MDLEESSNGDITIDTLNKAFSKTLNPKSPRTYRQVEARRTATREQRAIDFTYLRCPECGCDYDPTQGIRGYCSPVCQLNGSFNARRDSGESASTFGYRW